MYSYNRDKTNILNRLRIEAEGIITYHIDIHVSALLFIYTDIGLSIKLYNFGRKIFPFRLINKIYIYEVQQFFDLRCDNLLIIIRKRIKCWLWFSVQI